MPDTVNKFAPGTKVIYGVAGLCTVEGLVTMEVGGTQISMLKLVDGNGAVFKVSPAKMAKLGIRAVTSPEDVAAVLEGVEKSPPPRWDTSFGTRTKRHAEMIQKGGVAEFAAVVRELAAMVGARSEKSLEGVDRENFDKAKRRLADEMHAALGVPSSAAEDALDRLVYSTRDDAFRTVDDLDAEDLDELDDLDLDDFDLSMDDDETMALLEQEEGAGEGIEDDALSDAVSLDAMSRGRKRRGNRESLEMSVLSGNAPGSGIHADEEVAGSHVDAALAEIAEEARHRKKSVKSVKSSKATSGVEADPPGMAGKAVSPRTAPSSRTASAMDGASSAKAVAGGKGGSKQSCEGAGESPAKEKKACRPAACASARGAKPKAEGKSPTCRGKAVKASSPKTEAVAKRPGAGKKK